MIPNRYRVTSYIDWWMCDLNFVVWVLEYCDLLCKEMNWYHLQFGKSFQTSLLKMMTTSSTEYHRVNNVLSSAWGAYLESVMYRRWVRAPGLCRLGLHVSDSSQFWWMGPGALEWQRGYQALPWTHKKHPNHIFFRYENRPKYTFLHAFF